MNSVRRLVCLGIAALVAACGAADDTIENGAHDQVSAEVGASSIAYKGVSLAGAEFAVDPYGNGPLPGTFGVNYIYPDATYVSGYNSPRYFLDKGMNAFRLPFRWERLQPNRASAFDRAELDRLTTTVSHLTASGATVILDPHNYARYGTSVIGTAAVPNSQFADFWSRLATTFRSNPKVVFGLMNEPHDMSSEQWAAAANAAIAAIRQTGAKSLILVPGNGWTGGASWAQNWYGTPNATVMLTIKDPGNNFAFEVHQYLDADGGGGSTTCVSTTIGSQRLQGFTSWLRANGRRGFVGELGASSNATCLAALDDMLKHVEANSDVYLGWTYWAAGPWWGNNWIVIEPSGGADTKQMTTLLPHLGPYTPPPTCTDGVLNGSEVGVDCGGTCPACPSTCQAKVYDAAAMTHSTGGPAPGSWNLWSNGYIATTHSFTAGQTPLTVKAHGSVAGGIWPHMIVSVDGKAIGNVFVNSASDANYAFTLAAMTGSHELRVTFDNDAIVGTQDRNLYVANLTLGCGSTGPTCTDGTKNGTETGIDCGGSCAACVPTCTDGIKNGTETGIDCGGSCAACGVLRIMPLGDSITLGVNGGYRNGLWNRLLAAGRTVDFVGSQADPYAKAPDDDHEGHPGFTIGNIAASADAWLLTYTPKYVLLMAGTNDVAWWCAQTASQVADLNAALIDRILTKLPGVWLIVGSIPPLTSSVIQPNNIDRAQLAKDYDAELRKRVQARMDAGKRVRFADVASVLKLSDLYDGVHPSEAAADKVAQVWFDALLPILP